MNAYTWTQFKSIIIRCYLKMLSIIKIPRQRVPTAEKMAEHLSKYDVISFDIFDTLVFRVLPHPTDVFQLLEEELKIEGFKDKRISAEAKARRVCGKPNGEINIFDIYDQLIPDLSMELSTGINAEIQMERKCCYANPYMKTVFDTVQTMEKEIIAVSDMYLPADILRNLLAEMRYEGFFHIFVSCDCGCGKGNGELQQLVSNIVGPNKRIVHIGDNYRSDFLASKRVGWDTIWYPQPDNTGQRGKQQKELGV